MKARCSISAERLRRVWDLGRLGLQNTAEAPDLEGLVGQERAVGALNFGLSIGGPGYNIFVAGPSGTGKTSYTTQVTRAYAARRPAASDWVYVHNFDRPDEPVALELSAGTGPAFAHDVRELVCDARGAATRALESGEHRARHEQAIGQARQEIARVMEELEETVRDAGFLLSQTESGLAPVPAMNGQSMTEAQFAELAPDAKRELQRRSSELREWVGQAGHKAWELEKSLQEQVRTLAADAIGRALEPVVRRMQGRYKHSPRVHAWLGRLEKELVGHTVPDLGSSEALEEAAATAAPEAAGVVERAHPVEFDARFQVNVLVHHPKKSAGAPVVIETNPTYFNLFGKAEFVSQPEVESKTGVMHIKAGAVHRANGGYLILQVVDVLRNPGAWESLKRALGTREVRIEVPDQDNRVLPVEIVRPQPISLNVKVVLIGGANVYQALYAQDEGFRKLFKIKAEFDDTMDATEENVEGYARFISQVCRRDKLLHLDETAVARLVEHSHRLAEDQTKLSARFNEVVEVIYEANAWAAQAGLDVVSGGQVLRAIQGKAERSAAPERHLQQMIERGTIMMDVDGAVVGQVNGLTVMNVGDYSFGSPSRITARVYSGQKGIMHIEREIDMTGQIHDKGLFTLSGFLGDRFAQDKPLSISASIAFEQTYMPVDGDSASSTELYAMLSALADVPIDQGIAVTGSVNQRGQVQPIGGVNEKVEGFFGVCKLRGLTGRQGVMIPKQNLVNLMLSEEVVEAVRNGQFHLWAVGSIEEGIEILTGMPAGQRQADGRYAPGTLFERVDRRIETLVRNLSLWH